MNHLADALLRALSKKSPNGEAGASWMKGSSMSVTNIVAQSVNGKYLKKDIPPPALDRPHEASYVGRWFDRQMVRARREGIFTTTVRLTPELAELLLSKNPNNRAFSPNTPFFLGLCRDIREGKWQHNGETIVVSDTGELNDGGHRCNAVAATGVSIVTEMTFGPPRETRSSIDTGIKKTVGAHGQMRGWTDANVRANTGTVLLWYRQTGKFVRPASDKRPTASEIIAIIEDKDNADDITHSMSMGKGVSRKYAISSGLAAALHFEFARLDKDMANDFFEAIKTGVLYGRGLTRGPIYNLRERQLGRKTAVRLTYAEKGAAVINAWNAWRLDRPAKSFLKDGVYPKPE